MLPLSDWYDAGEWFDYGSHRIWFRLGGDTNKPPLLLIHGFPTASWDWHPLWDELAQRYRLVAFDMIGFGWSDKPRPYPYALMDQADLAEQLCTKLGLQSVHLLAHDYGDSVAQELLARHLDGQAVLGIESCVLLNGGIIPGEHRPTRVQRLLASPLGWVVSRMLNRRSFERAFRGIFGPNTRPGPEELAACWDLIVRNQGNLISHRLIGYMAERERFRDRWVDVLKDTQIPLLLIDGLEDPVSGAHVVEAYRKIRPSADVVELAGIGHYPQLEAPDRVLKAVRAFADQNGF